MSFDKFYSVLKDMFVMKMDNALRENSVRPIKLWSMERVNAKRERSTQNAVISVQNTVKTPNLRDRTVPSSVERVVFVRMDSKEISKESVFRITSALKPRQLLCNSVWIAHRMSFTPLVDRIAETNAPNVETAVQGVVFAIMAFTGMSKVNASLMINVLQEKEAIAPLQR